MDVGGDLIWGNDGESEVFVQAQSQEMSIIFKYSLNPQLPQSLPSRIVAFIMTYRQRPAKRSQIELRCEKRIFIGI